MLVGVKATGAYGWQPTTVTVLLSRKLGASGPTWPVRGLLYLYITNFALHISHTSFVQTNNPYSMIHQHYFEVTYNINYRIFCSCVTNNFVFSNLNASLHTQTHRPIKIHTIHLLTTTGLTPVGSSTAHIYTQTIHRTTQFTYNNTCDCFKCTYLLLPGTYVTNPDTTLIQRGVLYYYKCRLSAWYLTIQ